MRSGGVSASNGSQAAPAPAIDPTRWKAIVARFRPLLAPRVVAVAGASATGFTPANDFIRQCLALGFSGRMVPIHPKAATVEGLPAARTLADVGEPIDYLYVAVSAAQVPELVASGAGRARKPKRRCMRRATASRRSRPSAGGNGSRPLPATTSVVALSAQPSLPAAASP